MAYEKQNMAVILISKQYIGSVINIIYDMSTYLKGVISTDSNALVCRKKQGSKAREKSKQKIVDKT
jgi:hypothetical protein